MTLQSVLTNCLYSIAHPWDDLGWMLHPQHLQAVNLLMFDVSPKGRGQSAILFSSSKLSRTSALWSRLGISRAHPVGSSMLWIYWTYPSCVSTSRTAPLRWLSQCGSLILLCPTKVHILLDFCHQHHYPRQRKTGDEDKLNCLMTSVKVFSS